MKLIIQTRLINITWICLFGLLTSVNLFSQLTSKNENLKQELRLCRNEIFARHGRTFKSNDLKDYFEMQSWHSPNPDYNDSLLTSRELLAVKTILRLENEYDNFSEREKSATRDILEIIKKYYNRKIDTVFLTFGNFDGVPPIDTIKTYITELDNEVIIYYSFLRNGKPIWVYEHKNPYLWIGDSPVFDYLWNNIFISGFNAIKRSIAENWEKNEYYENMLHDWAFMLGYGELKRKGISVDSAGYRKFINEFNNDVLLHSHDESGGKLQIWYEPAKQFVTLYAP